MLCFLYYFSFIFDNLLINFMHQSAELTTQHQQPLFTKGMTLQQYLAKNALVNSHQDIEKSEKQQQNLYQSSRNKRMESFKPRNSNYRIDQIDEQSIEDSIQSVLNEQHSLSKKNLRTKQSQFQFQPMLNNRSNPRINNVHINSNVFLQNSMNQKNTQKPAFRVKRSSVSPHKKNKNQTGMGMGSITLYGNKFNLSTNKKQNKMPQLVTFYGKLNHHNPQKTSNKKPSTKSIQNKYNFNKKNYLQINELIEFQNRIKLNYSQRTYYDDVKRDRIKQKASSKNQNIY